MKPVIDWSKAPELAEYNYKGDWWRLVNGTMFRWEDKVLTGSFESGKHWARTSHSGLADKMTERPEPSPVFTQAMVDNGELPSVGCRVIYVCCNRIGSKVTDAHRAHDNKEMTVVALDNSLIVLISDDKAFVTACNDQWVKPIDTRTDKEKAIDYMQYAYDKGNNMADVLSEIEKGYVKGVSFQPLTVEGE